MEDIETLRRAAKNIEGRTICAFGEAAAWPVGGCLKHFYDEFVYHVEAWQMYTASWNDVEAAI